MGSGLATQPFLETQYHLTGIEPGKYLARLAKDQFQHYNNFTLFQNTLQDYVHRNNSFDLIYAATAFHWIPEEYGYKKVYSLLKSNVVFARFAYHAGRDKKQKSLMDKIQRIYDQYMPQSRRRKEFCKTNAKRLAAIALQYGFTNIVYHIYHTTKDFTADTYIELLKTYPNHMALKENNRKKLFFLPSFLQRKPNIFLIPTASIRELKT